MLLREKFVMNLHWKSPVSENQDSQNELYKKTLFNFKLWPVKDGEVRVDTEDTARR